MAGIVGYGAYVPRNRIKTEEIARQWGEDPGAISRGLLIQEKSVPGLDEDTITISVAAARGALDRAGIDPSKIGAVYVGSESHPYAVKPSGTIVSEALGIAPEVHVADFEFACKAGTEAMFVALGLVESSRVEYAMGIGADTSQGAPNDALEFSASAGGAAPSCCRSRGLLARPKWCRMPGWRRVRAAPAARPSMGASRLAPIAGSAGHWSRPSRATYDMRRRAR